ncbi:MAG: UDP-2,3-diacylglucosamine diphosphatase LpxI [Alphaproteobacteria bacterium]|nr:UDP-2,3-diacylglucosamine diphosphatase LpxI [Alphaproteobacteria bacterium]
MSAPQEIINIDRLGIIAGGGNLPAYLLSVCENKGIKAYVVVLNGQCDEDRIKDLPQEQTLWANLGSAGKIIDFFKQNDITDLVLIGSVMRPALSQIKPDMKAIQILSRIGFKALGDDGLLSAIKSELEREGFVVRAIQDFCDKLLMPRGVLGDYENAPEDEATIELGIRTSQEIGALDIGQSVIVQDGLVIGVEGVEGTDNLIKRCFPLLKPGARGGILVKTCKPQQNTSLDLPTIGVDTIQNAYESGLKGIVLQAGYTLLVDPKSIAEYANKYSIFVVGVDITQIS